MRSGLLAAMMAIALASSSLLMSGPSARGSPDLLLDEGFEDGVTGWSTAGGTLATTSSNVHSGSQSALFFANDDGGGLIQHQSIPIRPLSSYALSASVFTNDPLVESVTLKIQWQDENHASVGWSPPMTTTGTDDEWRSIAVNAQSPSRAAFGIVLVYVDSSISGQAYLDDIELEGPPPLPATATHTASPEPSSTLTSVPSATPTRTPAATATPSPVPSPTPTPRARDSLVNGGFEEADGGFPSGWQKYGGELTQTSTHYRSGSHSGAFRSTTGSTKWAFQAITVTGGSAYEFSTYALVNDPSAPEVYLRISWYTSDDASGSAVAQSDSPARLSGSDPAFRYMTTGPALAPEAARSARFRVMLAPASSAPATVYLDDASLQQVPPQLAATPAPPPPAGLDEPEADVPPPAAEGGRQRQAGATARSPARQGESPFAVKVNEVMYDPAPSGDDAAYEWLELYNAGSEAVDLAGWTLNDNSTNHMLPSITLAPASYVVVAASDRFRESYPDFAGALIAVDSGRIGSGLANKGDRLLLSDPSGKVADGLSWGDDEAVLSPPVAAVASGHSLERSPAGHDTDAAADFIDNANPSPGRGIGEPAVAGVSIERQVAGSSVVYPPPEPAVAESSSTALRLLVSLTAGAVALLAGLSAGLYGGLRFRQWP